MFTHAAVQRAMNEKAARWGAPAGYYTVEERVRKLSHEEQVWAVRIRLFGGRAAHIEGVVFIRDGYGPSGQITYSAISDKYSGPSSHKLAGSKAKDCASSVSQHDLQAGTIKDALMKGTSWTQPEDRVIQEDAVNGIPITQTARKLGRTYYGIGRRRIQLGVARPNHVVGETRG